MGKGFILWTQGVLLKEPLSVLVSGEVADVVSHDIFSCVDYVQEKLFKNIKIILLSLHAFWPRKINNGLLYSRNIISCKTPLQVICDVSQNKLSVTFLNS